MAMAVKLKIKQKLIYREKAGGMRNMESSFQDLWY
jgi:hypothetical protein